MRKRDKQLLTMALRGLLIALEIFLVLRLTAILLFAKNTPNSDLNDLVN